LAPAATPATVTFTLDTSARVAKDIPLTGGSLKAVAKDGTTFELTVPGDALFSPETIVMTPAIITSHPFSGEPAWGVELLPDGLVFNAPVTLVITPPTAAPPVKQQVPFGWSGPGHTAFLANPDPKDARLALKLLHFSSYAYATALQGMSASLAGVRNRIGGSAEARIQSAAAELLGVARQKELLGVAEENVINSAEMQMLMQEYDKEVVQVRVAAAKTSCAAGRLAVNTVLAFSRQKQLLSIPDPAGLPYDLFEEVDAVCLEEEWALCRDQHIVQRIIPLVLGMERQRQLANAPEWGADLTMKALTYPYKCHQYQLEITSSTGTTCDQWMFEEPVLGKVDLKLGSGPPADLTELFSAKLEGMAPLKSSAYSIKYTDKCTAVLNVMQIDPRFVVSGLGWTLKTDPLMSGKGEIKDFDLAGAPTLPQDGNFLLWGSTHQTQETCGMPLPPPETIPNFNWWSIFVIALGENPTYFDDTKGWGFKNWMVYNNGGALLARKVVDEKVVDGGINYTTSTTFLLTHKPAQ
jgi:hypothetical protein